jgi:hypothetical protein
MKKRPRYSVNQALVSVLIVTGTIVISAFAFHFSGSFDLELGPMHIQFNGSPSSTRLLDARQQAHQYHQYKDEVSGVKP